MILAGKTCLCEMRIKRGGYDGYRSECCHSFFDWHRPDIGGRATQPLPASASETSAQSQRAALSRTHAATALRAFEHAVAGTDCVPSAAVYCARRLAASALPARLTALRPRCCEMNWPASTTRSRSMPVAIPSPCIMYNTSSVATLPVAPLA